MKLATRIDIKGELAFRTAFHLGSGDRGSGESDLGVLLDINGRPLLPGSSLKGAFRATADALMEHLGMTTCFLDREQLKFACSSTKISKRALDAIKKASIADIDAKLAGFAQCDCCRLFGSLLEKGRVRFHDAAVKTWSEGLELRDGVAIDRDSGTAAEGAKYNYEVVPAGASFNFHVVAENLDMNAEAPGARKEAALFAAILSEWQRGVYLGGMTTRGLGHAQLQRVIVREVDFTDPPQRLAYLLNHEMQDVGMTGMVKALRTVLEEQRRTDA